MSWFPTSALSLPHCKTTGFVGLSFLICQNGSICFLAWCWLDSSKLEGEVCRALGISLCEGALGFSAWLPCSSPSPTALPTAPPFLSFTPSSPGAASQQKESLGSNDEDGCVIDSAPLPSALLVEN